MKGSSGAAKHHDIRHRPQAEVHLHIEGTVEPKLTFDLAERNGIAWTLSSTGCWRTSPSGRSGAGCTDGLIPCFVRDQPVASVESMLDSVAHRFGDLLGVGLDSAKVGYPPALFDSDDPAYFGGYVGDNFAALESIGFTLAELAAMARNSVYASFAAAPRKAELLAEIDNWNAARQA